MYNKKNQGENNKWLKARNKVDEIRKCFYAKDKEIEEILNQTDEEYEEIYGELNKHLDSAIVSLDKAYQEANYIYGNVNDEGIIKDDSLSKEDYTLCLKWTKVKMLEVLKNKKLKLINWNCGMNQASINLNEYKSIEDIVYMITCILDNTINLIEDKKNKDNIYYGYDLEIKNREFKIKDLQIILDNNDNMFEIASNGDFGVYMRIE